MQYGVDMMEDRTDPSKPTPAESASRENVPDKDDETSKKMITCPHCSMTSPMGSPICPGCGRVYPSQLSRLIYIFFKKIMETLSQEGVKNIQNAIRSFVDAPVDIRISSSNFLDTALIPEKIGGYDTPVVALLSETKPELKLRNSLLFSNENAKKLSNLLLEGRGEGNFSCSNSYIVEMSSLKEFSNVVTASFLNVLSNIIHTKILCSTSVYITDSIGQVIDFVLFTYPESKGKTFMVSFEINYNNEGTYNKEGSNNAIPFILMVIFSENDLEVLMQKSLEGLKSIMSSKL